VTGGPEPLRPFDPDGEEPAARARASSTATPAVPSTVETPPCSTGDASERTDLLRYVAEAARMEASAREGFDAAVEAARAAGHSWRTLGIATGIPHQTLHRRSQHDRSGRTKEA